MASHQNGSKGRQRIVNGNITNVNLWIKLDVTRVFISLLKELPFLNRIFNLKPNLARSRTLLLVFAYNPRSWSLATACNSSKKREQPASECRCIRLDGWSYSKGLSRLRATLTPDCCSRQSVRRIEQPSRAASRREMTCCKW